MHVTHRHYWCALLQTMLTGFHDHGPAPNPGSPLMLKSLKVDWHGIVIRDMTYNARHASSICVFISPNPKNCHSGPRVYTVHIFIHAFPIDAGRCAWHFRQGLDCNAWHASPSWLLIVPPFSFRAKLQDPGHFPF